MTIGLFPFVVDSVKPLIDGGQSKTDLRHLRMCCVRTRSKHEASSQNLTRKTSHLLNIPYNFLNGFDLISKMTRGTSQSVEIPCLNLLFNDYIDLGAQGDGGSKRRGPTETGGGGGGPKRRGPKEMGAQ